MAIQKYQYVWTRVVGIIRYMLRISLLLFKYKRKFLPEENFCQFRHVLLLAKFFLSANYLSHANDYIEDMATFTAFGENLF